MEPQVSVVVRSYNRVQDLCQLLPVLLRQRHDSFEVVIVEQSTKVAPEDRARLEELAQDPRVRLLQHPPLGGPRARNVGVEAARGEVVIFIDDDDLPENDEWISAHAANYQDPKCLGVSGRQKFHPNEENPYTFKWLAYYRCMKFSPLLKFPWTYVRQTRRKVPIEAIHGTNGSIRRTAYERFGGWDEDTKIEDEASFAFRVARLKEKDEYFVFDPLPVVVRGLDIPGGLDKRYMTPAVYFDRFMTFVHNIIGRYFPIRLRLLYPLYVATVAGWTVVWIWGDSKLHSTFFKRIAGTLAFLPTVPYHTVRALSRVWRAGSKDNDMDSRARNGAPPPRSTSA